VFDLVSLVFLASAEPLGTRIGTDRAILARPGQMGTSVGRARFSGGNYFKNKFLKLGFIEYNNGTLKAHSSLLNVIVHD
jgi:hypothetical protein